MQNLSFLKFPSAKAETILTALLFITSIILFFILVGLIKEYLKKRRLKSSFFKEAFERGLTEREAEILWKYSLKMGRDPFLALEFKAPFEKVVDLYLREDESPDEELVQEMRSKLGFDYVPYFVPLVSTKDIELFQPAKLYLPDRASYDIALFDKDERYMYWAIIDEKTPAEKLEGKRVTISFIRKGDGIYKFEGVVTKTFYDNGKLILQIPHTFEMTRFQRREYARVDVELPAVVGIKEGDGIKWIEGEIVDISAGGAKVCIPLSALEKELLPGTEVKVKFKVSNREFNLRATVINVYERRHSNCYGLKFEDITPEQHKFLYDFVKKQQKKLAELALKARG